MEAKALNRYITTSPRKMRLVVDLIRGKKVDEAISILHFSPKHASRVVEKTLRSAVSNLQNKSEGSRLDNDNIFVKEAYVNEGPSMKRISPAPMGRAYRIIKRSNHLTLIVAEKKEVKKQAPKTKQMKKSSKKTEKEN
ncbi:MAG: 50S ribosomal protein L22 [Bacteroidota bacterium]|nr:50S ribosomal protein L22 [Bacteroidota bacterium]